MLHTRSQRIVLATFIAIALLVLFAALGNTHGTVSGDDNLPPRPTPNATPILPTAVADAPVTGALIRLQLSEPLPGAWTVVEWQNQQGLWFEVDGWRGHLDENGATSKSWWVMADNFGQTPFRWVLYASEDGRQLATSAPFTLPTRARQLLTIDLTLP